MPSNVPATTIRIEPEVKREAVAILDELGLREGGMPFEMRVAPRTAHGDHAEPQPERERERERVDRRSAPIGAAAEGRWS